MMRQPYPRNRTADLLKGIAVILMIQVHIMELFAQQDLFDSIIGKISLFLGGPPAAPVFMAVMGYYIAKSNKTFLQSCVRGLKIIALGFLLNIGLNFHLFIKIATGMIKADPLPYLFGVDILFLAGISIIGLAAIKLIRSYQFVFYSFSMVFIFVLQFFLASTSINLSENYLWAFFYGNDIWWSYFPFIPWFAYPLTGFIFYKMEGNLKFFIQKYLVIIFIVYAVVVIIFFEYGMIISADLDSYYHHDFMFFIYAVFFLIAWSAMASLTTQNTNNMALNYFEWLGKNVTSAYVIQWLIIGNIATALYKTQNLVSITLWFVLILAVTSGGIWVWTKTKHLNKTLN